MTFKKHHPECLPCVQLDTVKTLLASDLKWRQKGILNP